MGGKSASGGDGGGDIYWPWSTHPVPFPLSNAPVSIKDLIGRKFRVVRQGDVVNQEIDSGRVTIFLSKDNRIEEIYCDPDLPRK